MVEGTFHMMPGMGAARAKVTANGQVSLPAELRRRWATSTVLVVDRGDYAIVRPIPEDIVGHLKGSYAGSVEPVEELRAIERAAEAAGEHRRTTS